MAFGTRLRNPARTSTVANLNSRLQLSVRLKVGNLAVMEQWSSVIVRFGLLCHLAHGFLRGICRSLFLVASQTELS